MLRHLPEEFGKNVHKKIEKNIFFNKIVSMAIQNQKWKGKGREIKNVPTPKNDTQEKIYKNHSEIIKLFHATNENYEAGRSAGYHTDESHEILQHKILKTCMFIIENKLKNDVSLELIKLRILRRQLHEKQNEKKITLPKEDVEIPPDAGTEDIEILSDIDAVSDLEITGTDSD